MPVLAVFFLASFARADELRLTAPANGTTLRGGSYAELRWTAAELPPDAEEWEAFLSVDGGKYYAFRVTPHLDIELRSFSFVVPNVDTHDARILIRAGDEVDEEQFESDGSFSIVRDASAAPLVPRLLQSGGGEAAREGDPDVLAWADGARNGSGVTQQSSTALPSPEVDRVTEIAGDVPDALAPAGNQVDAPSLATTRWLVGARHTRRAEPLLMSVDLLLICRRRNI
jgi:hypothetical protein